jgi:uncharacterized protein (DUF2141 family)
MFQINSFQTKLFDEVMPFYFLSMKFALAFPALLLLYHIGFGQTGKVTILVKGINAKKGGLLTAGIFEKGNFPKTGKHLLGMSIEVFESTMQITFEHVPAGQFAVAVFQDEDRNKKLNTNIIGYPVELTGFSNDAKIRLGPPSFEEAKVSVENDQVLNLIIQLR